MDARFLEFLGSLYTLGGLVTLAVLTRHGAQHLWRWARTTWPCSLSQWVVASLLAIALPIAWLVSLLALVRIWPVVAAVMVQRAHRAASIRDAMDAEDDEELFRYVRRIRSGDPTASPDG
jgi:hypothetical protein